MAIVGLKNYPRDLASPMLGETPVYRLLGWDGARKARCPPSTAA